MAAALALLVLPACTPKQDRSSGAPGAGPTATPPETPVATGQAGGDPTPTPTPAAVPSSATIRPTPSRPPVTTPARATTTTRPATSRPPATGCPQGERQREVEGYLAALGRFGPVTVDGVQSAADCTAIKKFQQRYGIVPAEGRAGPTTADVARRLASTRTGDCRAGAGTTVCVNLTLQTVWVLRDGAVVLGPTVTRTGMAGYATPAGTYRIGAKNLREWSVPYQVWLPYWQQFNGGMGFHETTTYLHNMPNGSHGCVNLLHGDAVALWSLTRVGTPVYLFGRRPGT